MMQKFINSASLRSAGCALLFTALLTAAPPAIAQSVVLEPAFLVWQQDLRSEALARGIQPTLFDRALDGVAPIPQVIALDRSQPEVRMTFAAYLRSIVVAARVKAGREQLARHHAALTEIGAQFGVQPRFIVALWGVETNYGRNTGGFRVIPALATLAYDGRRSAYFRAELLDALTILQQGHIPLHGMRGSWAGAMGQNQFMPSSFLKYAVDGNGDGRKDIWTNYRDVFASTANYLKSVGWRADQTWGRAVRLPAGFSLADAVPERARPIADWAALGVRREDGGPLPTADWPAAIIAPDGLSGPSFMVYENFNHIMRWNRSTYFATSVGLLADRIGAP